MKKRSKKLTRRMKRILVPAILVLLMKTTKVHFLAIKSFNRISKILKKSSGRKITYKRGSKDIINGVEKVISVIRQRGFKLDTVFADNEFAKLEHKISAALEICGAGQHIPSIEREARSVKDRTR